MATRQKDACQRLTDLGADVVGLNCYRGPGTMLPILQKVTEKVKSHVAALPVAYHTSENEPTFEVLSDGKGNTVFPTLLDPHVATRDEMANFALEAYKLGARFIGGCCGTAPYHIRSMAEALGRKVAASKYSPVELTEEQKQYFIPVASMHKKGSL